jgi:hypothetical protein
MPHGDYEYSVPQHPVDDAIVALDEFSVLRRLYIRKKAAKLREVS